MGFLKDDIERLVEEHLFKEIEKVDVKKLSDEIEKNDRFRNFIKDNYIEGAVQKRLNKILFYLK